MTTKKKVAFLDCKCGVAGDMLLGALIDAGAPKEELIRGLKTILPLAEEWELESSKVLRSKGHIAATHVKVRSIYDHQEIPVGGGGGGGGGEVGHHHHDHDHHHHEHEHEHAHEHGHDHHHHHHHSHGDDDAEHGHTHTHSHSHEHSHGGPGHTHGDTPTHPHTHSHTHSHSHSHEHSHDHDHHHGPHRNLDIITDLIQNAEGLPPPVRAQSIAVFTALAEAEAATHGVTLDKIHFHEVGAVDSIIDTVGTVFALHLLGVEEVYATPLPFGEGMTRETAHGILPVPTPATLRLMLGIPTIPGPKGAVGELVTPTGASLVKVLVGGRYGQPPPFVPELLGVGAGTKDFQGHANVVRVVVGWVSEEVEGGGVGEEGAVAGVGVGGGVGADAGAAVLSTHHHHHHHQTHQTHRYHPVHGFLSEKGEPRHPLTTPANNTHTIHSPSTDTHTHPHKIPSAWSNKGWQEQHLCELEANLDDMTPETASFALERLLDEPGCLDVWYTPAVMKKGRPGLTLHLLCEPSVAPALLRVMFLETPTLGVRAHTVARLALERDFVVVPTRYGEVRAKVGRMDGVVVNVKPEYEDCKGAAMALGLPLRAVVDEATRVARGQVEESDREKGEGGEEGGEEGEEK